MKKKFEKLNLRPVAYASWKEARFKIQDLGQLDKSPSLLCISTNVQTDDLQWSHQEDTHTDKGLTQPEFKLRHEN